jgi:hypothetical protein
MAITLPFRFGTGTSINTLFFAQLQDVLDALAAVSPGTGSMLIESATAIPAGGTTGEGYKFSTTQNYGIFFGSGPPTLSAAKGSLYLRIDGTTTNDRAYINTNGSTAWTALTTAS